MDDDFSVEVCDSPTCSRLATNYDDDYRYCDPCMDSYMRGGSAQPLSDPSTLRAMAERWDNPNTTPTAVVEWTPGRTFTVGYLLRLVATAMEEAGEP